MGDPVTSDNKKTPEKKDGEESEGQYGGLKGLGYGGGRDIKDAERPARDIDFEGDEDGGGERNPS